MRTGRRPAGLPPLEDGAKYGFEIRFEPDYAGALATFSASRTCAARAARGCPARKRPFPSPFSNFDKSGALEREISV